MTIGTDASIPVYFRTAGSERMRIDSSGNVGIGTGSPDSLLHLQNASNFYIHLLKTGSNDGYVRNIGTMDIAAASGGGGGQCITFSTGGNYAGLTERGRFDGSGNFAVSANGSTNAGCQMNVTGYMGLGNSAGSSGFGFITFYRSGANIGNITQNGTTAVAYNTSSDYRLKDNIAPMTDALAKVAALKPCTYTWKSAPDEVGEGFIAHELAEVCPHAVTGEKDAVDEDGNPKYQGIDTSFLVATLTAAIQEQQALIASLTARIAALEAK